MTTAETLLAGPRGRRMLLAYARDAERTVHSEFRSDLFDHAVFLASYHLESGREGARVLFGPGAEEARRTVLTADDVAHRLSQVPLPEVTAVALRSGPPHRRGRPHRGNRSGPLSAVVRLRDGSVRQHLAPQPEPLIGFSAVAQGAQAPR